MLSNEKYRQGTLKQLELHLIARESSAEKYYY